jgi:hypothetical protein
MTSLTAIARRMLGLHRPRSLARRGRRPAIGAEVVHGDLRMTMQAGLEEELWQWLQDQGWRELSYCPDRRRYRDIPTSWVTRLIDATPEERNDLLASAMARASLRPKLRDPRVLPSYVVRD